MSPRPFVKLQDRVGSSADAPAALATDGLLGTWVNTDPGTQKLTRAVIERGPGPTGLTLRATGPCVDGLPGWGPTPIDALFASTPEGREAVAFTARFEAPAAAVEFHANMSKGLLILTHMSTYPAGAGLRDEFAREFFRLESGDAN